MQDTYFRTRFLRAEDWESLAASLTADSLDVELDLLMSPR